MTEVERIQRLERMLLAIYDHLPSFVKAFVAQSPAGLELETIRGEFILRSQTKEKKCKCGRPITQPNFDTCGHRFDICSSSHEEI